MSERLRPRDSLAIARVCLVMSLRYFFISGFLLFLAGCSGGGGGDDGSFVAASADTRIVAGFVEDGPVAGARVYLLPNGPVSTEPLQEQAVRRCWASGVGRCEATTDDRGHFTFSLALDADLDGYQVISSGGLDHATGVSYAELGLGFSAPLAAFVADPAQVTLSPLTTLLNDLVQSGQTLEASRQRLSAWSGLADPDQLLIRPSVSNPLLKRTLVLVVLIQQLQENGFSDPWGKIDGHLDTNPPLFDSLGAPDISVLQTTFLLSPDQADMLVELSTKLEAGSVAEAAYDQFNRFRIARVLADELDRFLTEKDAANFSASDSAYLANRQLLFSTISDAAGTAIPLWSWTPQKILQHVLFKYELTNFAAFQAATPDIFAVNLVRADDGQTISLAVDPRIADIVTGEPQHLVFRHLALDELLATGDNLARVRYYYNSDISHLRRADDLAQAVLDDQLNDELLVKLVKGTAASGMVKGWVSDELFPADLDPLIENRIQGSEFRGLAYYELALEANKLGLYAEALNALASAEQYFNVVLNAKGSSFFAESDASNFRLLAFEYGRAGDFAGAVRVLQFLHNFIAVPLATPLAYNNAFTAGMSLFDDAVERGEFSFAAVVVDELRQIALGTPADFSSSGIASYRTQIIHFVETSRRYAILGESQRALDLYYGPGMIADLRTNDGLLSGDSTYKNKTGSYTAAYMDEMAEALHLAGDASGAFDLLDTLSAVSRAKGYKLLATAIATREAMVGGLQSPHPVEPPVEDMNALDLVFYRVPTDTFNPTLLEAQVDALTYFVANRSAVYVAPTLIEHGFDEDAAVALGRAVDLVRMLDDNLEKPYGLGNSKIDFGYAKVADLYVDIGREQVARALLVEAEGQVLPKMTDAGLVNKSLAAMADVYLRLGDVTTAERLLARASETFSLDSYDVLVSALLRIHSSQASQVIDDYVALIRSLYLPETMTDDELFLIVTHLGKAAAHYSSIGRQDAALATLAMVLQPAMEVKAPASRVNKLIEWAEGYARIDEFSQALDTVRVIEGEGFSVSRNKAFLAIGTIYAARKDFGANLGVDLVARVDLDKDGQPDFFNPLASAADIEASELMLDEDMDGDGMPDSADTRPLYFDSAQ